MRGTLIDADSKYFTKGSTFLYDAIAAFAWVLYLSLINDHCLSLLMITSKHL
jgi:hypothetical protein